MPIIFICSDPFGEGERLARGLAEKLGYGYLGREDVVAKATDYGIPVGKLEVAMVKKPAVRERLARLKERYLAVATSTICEKAAEGDLVYHGRSGHFLLPGVSHVLRVRVLPERSQRIAAVMQRTRLSREKAEKFLDDIDSDVRAWVHFVHGADMDDLRRYDLVLNLEHMSVENAAAALCGIVDLPDFRPTPASRRAMAERLLQARARIKLALDERTADADLTVRSNDGVLTVTYMPRQAALADVIPSVLREVEGCREVRCTVASTNILWIQEQFRPDGATLADVTELAKRWGAAVELVRYVPGEESGASDAPEPAVKVSANASGGIEDDVPDKSSPDERSFRDTVEALVHEGRSGGGQTVVGSVDKLLSRVNPDIQYSLVAVGDVQVHKPAAVRMRATRALTTELGHRLKAPVIPTSELGQKVHFGASQVVKLVISAAVVAAIYVGVFGFQAPLLDVLGGAAHRARPWVAPLLVAAVAPVVAWAYGIVAASFLKLIRLE